MAIQANLAAGPCHCQRAKLNWNAYYGVNEQADCQAKEIEAVNDNPA